MNQNWFRPLNNKMEKTAQTGTFDIKGFELSEDCKHCNWPKLYEMTGIMNSLTADFTQALTTIVDLAIQVTDGERGILLLYDEAENLLIKMARTRNRGVLNLDSIKISRSIINDVIRTEKAIYIDNVLEDNEFSPTESIIDLSLRSVMCAPLKVIVRDEYTGRERRRISFPAIHQIIGVIYIDSSQASTPFSPIKLTLLEALSSQATTTIINSRLYHLAITDPLTDLFIRRQFHHCLSDELALARDLNKPVAVTMIDLDNFKEVNDLFGHDEGDKVLINLSHILRSCTRKFDVCARYGGEEFVIMLSNTGQPGAFHVAEKIRNSVQKRLKRPDGNSISISIGIALFPDDASNGDELIKRADQALYLAKKTGKNCSKFFSEINS